MLLKKMEECWQSFAKYARERFPRCSIRSLNGNPVQIGDGPAAVTGDAFRKHATVFLNGKARNKDEPEVRRPALKNHVA